MTLTSTISILELADVALPRGTKPKVLVLLRAYLDETFRPGVAMIAGLVGTDQQWATVGQRWQATLDKHGAPYFHGSSVMGQRARAVAPADREHLIELPPIAQGIGTAGSITGRYWSQNRHLAPIQPGLV